MAFVGVNRKGGTKFNWNKAEVVKLIGAASAQALQRAGLLVRRNSQRQMKGGGSTSGRVVPKEPTFRVYGTKDGYPVVGAFHAVPVLDKVSTWSPRAWLRNDIEADWDNTRKSVVIGPSKAPWLNQLHEFGGTRQYWIGGTKWPRREIFGKRLPRKITGGSSGRAYVGYIVDRPSSSSISIGSRRVSGRGYMKKGLDKSLPDIPQQFRNRIRKNTL